KPEIRRERENEKTAAPSGLYEPVYEKKTKEVKHVAAEPRFIRVTRQFSGLMRSMGKGAKFTDDQQEALNFLEWDVNPENFRAAYFGILAVGIFVALILSGIAYHYFFNDTLDTTVLIVSGVLVFAAIGISYYYLGYPKAAAENEKLMALAYVPEIVNYLSMSLRLVPNLEKAVEFAANHGQGKIAEELKKIVWDVQLGRYESMEEALDELAYKWGPYNDDFKQALMLIRGSILETDSKKREDLLNKASADVLEGAREKMDLYARKLQQPTVYLYYFGILLPLLLAIILPIGSTFANMPLAKAEYLFLAYNVVLPILVFLFGKQIIASRPPTYVPPDVPEDQPGLPPKGTFRLGGMIVPAKTLGILALLLFVFLGFLTDQGWMQNQVNAILGRGIGEEFIIGGTIGSIPSYLDPVSRQEAIAALPHLTFFDKQSLALGPLVILPKGTFIGQFLIFGLLIGFSLLVSLWLLGAYWERKKVQDEIRYMEGEFQDALYVLASRLGENKPIEEALRASVQFLPKSKVGKTVFKRILENITFMGLTLEDAIFDKTFGVVKNLPSRLIRSGLQFMVDAVQLGVNVAAKSLISFSMQLRNAQKTDESLKRLLSDVTTMLKTMSIFVAPIVLGVVSAMQRIIVNSLAQQNSGGSSQLNNIQNTGLGGFEGLSQLFQGSDVLKSIADPTTFVLVMGVYVLEIVAILTYFNSQIEDTNNKLHTWVSVAWALPIAAALYCFIAFFSSSFIGALSGSGG
ncbi:TPA: hypothetical protein HA244_05745, partial [Candidatus Micrarchaeota archaeon]|nr:hypothetical protein [Candidatus Micrarchaeota archaeon]